MTGKGALIAVVNTDPGFLQMIADFLEDEGHQSLCIQENNTAFMLIKQHMPALVIIELLLASPESGWTILNTLRRDPQTEYIPVIVASTAAELLERNQQHLREQGCATLLMPFSLAELLALVAKFVKFA